MGPERLGGRLVIWVWRQDLQPQKRSRDSDSPGSTKPPDAFLHSITLC